tara:strand:- start:21437 stop:22966 length:1530 start_codon:yes stop_codon:yes gene_type:complete
MIFSPDRIHTVQITAEETFIPIGDGLEVYFPPDAQNGDTWDLFITPFKTEQPLVTALLSEQVFLSSKREILSQLHKNLVIANNNTDGNFSFPTKQDQSIQDYRTEILVQFFNHLFLVKGKTVYWTDLDRYLNWYPDTNNEADFRELEGENDDATALVRVNDVLFLHFPQAIYSIEYIGKPTIVRILSRSQGTGAINPRAIAVHQSIQYFLGLDNFYLFSPESGVKAIGAEVWKGFVAFCTDFSKVWSYVDIINFEICWVFEDRILAFNYREGHWTKMSSEGIVAHTSTGWINNLQVIEQGVESESIIDTDKFAGLENLWVTADRVCREMRLTDKVSGAFTTETPYLISDNFTYGDIFRIKTVDVITFDCRYDNLYDGIRVYISAREFVTDRVVWKEVGVWRQRGRTKQLDFPGVAGRVFKYKFELVPFDNKSDGLRYFNEGQDADGIGKDTNDGFYYFDGDKEENRARQVQYFDGQITSNNMITETFGYFEINAWGEVMDMPVNVGPEK